MPRNCHRCGTSLSGDVASCPGCGTAIRPAFGATVAADDEIETVVERVLSPMPVPLRGSRGEDANDQTIRGRIDSKMSRAPQSEPPPPPPQDIPTVKTPLLSMQDIARLKEEFASTVPRAAAVQGVWTGEDTQPILINAYDQVPAAHVAIPPARTARRRSRLLAVAAIIFVAVGAVAFGISRFLREPARPAVVQSRELPSAAPITPVAAPTDTVEIEPVVTETAPPSEQLSEVMPLIEEIPQTKPVARQPVRPATRRRTPTQTATAPVVPVSQTPPPVVVKEGDLAQLGDAQLVAPQLSQDVDPKYPVRARMNGVGGRVELQLLIDHHGAVERVEVGRSSGNALLDNSAIIAAKRSRFRPATKQGVPVKIWITRTYNFRPNS